jgi:AAA domain/UvrD-like helicase C-terminal domain
MLNSPEKPKPTDEQIEICRYIKKEKGNLQVNALAGGGKTSTIELMMEDTKEPTLYLAFNASVVKEAMERLPSGVKIRTINSQGLQCWGEGNGKAVTDPKKMTTLIREYIYGLRGKDKEDASEAYWDLLGAVSMAKNLGYVPEGKFNHAKRLCTREELCARIENRLTPFGLKIVDDLLCQSIQIASAGTLDFNDQVYMPALFGGSFPRFPLVYVDERQDLSPTNVALLERCVPKVTGRLVEVGDRWQAIYAFRGAETDGMNRSKDKFKMNVMALSYSFRCPENIVKAVHWHVPHMRWLKTGGTYEVLSALDPADIPDGAAIICRNNAPLFKAAFALLAKKRSVQVAGSDIGPKILRLLGKVGSPGDSSEDLMFKIDAWRDAQLEKTNSPQTVHDQAECMKVFASWGNSYDQAVGYAKHIFEQQGTIKLSTGHKAKGAEWDTVYHLDKHLLSKDEQDLNLKYVITTRAKQELFEIKTEELQW